MSMLIVLSALLLAAAPARAVSLSPDVEQTFGSRRYQDTSVSIDIGDAYHVRPGAEISRSDTSGGTRREFTLDAGHRGRVLDLELSGGFRPQVAGYSTLSFGGGATWKWTAPEDSVFDRIRLGASVEETLHHDHFQFVQTGPATNGGGPGPGGGGGGGPGGGGGDGGGDFRAGTVSARVDPIVIHQTEAELSAGVEVLDFDLKVSGSRSYYDKDLNGVHAREIEAQEILGTDIIVQGYPQWMAHARLSWDALDWLSPYAGWTHTFFLLGDPPSTALVGGFAVYTGDLTTTLGYERYAQGDVPVRNYYSLELGYDF